MGVFIVCFGAYILGISSGGASSDTVHSSHMSSEGKFSKFVVSLLDKAAHNIANVLEVKGSRYCVIIAGLWSISSSFDKLGRLVEGCREWCEDTDVLHCLGTMHGGAILYSSFIHSFIAVPSVIQYYWKDRPGVAKRQPANEVESCERHSVCCVEVYRRPFSFNPVLSSDEPSANEHVNRMARRISPLALICVTVIVGRYSWVDFLCLHIC